MGSTKIRPWPYYAKKVHYRKDEEKVLCGAQVRFPECIKTEDWSVVNCGNCLSNKRNVDSRRGTPVPEELQDKI